MNNEHSTEYSWKNWPTIAKVMQGTYTYTIYMYFFNMVLFQANIHCNVSCTYVHT